MSMETGLVALLVGICPRTFPDVAPAGTALPYVVWQGLGGESLRYGDGTAPAKRNTYLQVSVWSETRAEALSMIRQVEESLATSPLFASADPESEARSTYEPETKRYGSIQRFSVWADR